MIQKEHRHAKLYRATGRKPRGALHIPLEATSSEERALLGNYESFTNATILFFSL